MRQVYALLGLVRRYGDVRVNAACVTALAAEMLSVRRLARRVVPNEAQASTSVAPSRASDP